MVTSAAVSSRARDFRHPSVRRLARIKSTRLSPSVVTSLASEALDCRHPSVTSLTSKAPDFRHPSVASLASVIAPTFRAPSRTPYPGRHPPPPGRRGLIERRYVCNHLRVVGTPCMYVHRYVSSRTRCVHGLVGSLTGLTGFFRLSFLLSFCGRSSVVAFRYL